MAVIRLSDMSLRYRMTTKKNPEALLEGGTKLYVTNSDADSIFVIDIGPVLATTVIRAIPDGNRGRTVPLERLPLACAKMGYEAPA
jgi:YVTN family beta-propeller protein